MCYWEIWMGAAVIKLGRGDSTLILVLDRNFLGQKAPLDNVKWAG